MFIVIMGVVAWGCVCAHVYVLGKSKQNPEYISGFAEEKMERKN